MAKNLAYPYLMNGPYSFEKITAYRQGTFKTRPGSRVASRDQAVDFVNERGFILFWPIKGITMPSLWAAAAGDRPVPNDHDDPGHITWNWKDDMLGKRLCHYGKVLRRKATFISFDLLPYFYALSNNFGSPEEDHLILYEQGNLSLEAKDVYEALLDKGPLDSLALRKAAHLTNKERDSGFNRALEDLQADFKIMPVGIASVGAWRYAFIYDLVSRYNPEVVAQAHPITQSAARDKLVETYLASVGAAQYTDLVKLFHWPPQDVKRAAARLVEKGALADAVTFEDKAGEWFVLKKLV